MTAGAEGGPAPSRSEASWPRRVLNNSSKYTLPGGLIELSARRDGSNVHLQVRDNGVGIPPEQIEHVFEMFSQVNRTLDSAQSGLGIGLALVLKPVDAAVLDAALAKVDSLARGRSAMLAAAG